MEWHSGCPASAISIIVTKVAFHWNEAHHINRTRNNLVGNSGLDILCLSPQYTKNPNTARWYCGQEIEREASRKNDLAGKKREFTYCAIDPMRGDDDDKDDECEEDDGDSLRRRSYCSYGAVCLVLQRHVHGFQACPHLGLSISPASVYA